MPNRNRWIWAVGIEDTFIGQTARGERPLDEYELIQHYRFWREDLDRVRDSGAAMIRYGIPWYRVEPEDGVYDWSWTDQVMAYFESHPELRPIVDLMHYGTPLWLKNEFMNARYPELVARYAAAFAARYAHIVPFYTPLNEPWINAEWCGWSGVWPPYLQGRLGFALMMNQLCKGIVRTVQALKRAQPESVMVHVEASKKFVPSAPACEKEAAFWNELRYVMWELVQGRISAGHPLYEWALNHHIHESDLEWYRDNRIEPDIIGVNYYPQFSVNSIDESVILKEQIPAPVPGTAEDMKHIVHDLYRRYGKPIMITETSYNGTVAERVDWLNEVIQASEELVREGVELYGVTWFPFFDMADWPYRTNGLPRRDNMATFGLYTLEEQEDGTLLRVKNAAAERFEAAARQSSSGEGTRTS
ncbi:family 1 glycosylhydrolase [Cohnella zeiphila]|uniref:Family 1 glycosylhydrolase n=1 Tax=Cohnella zeiphila TaxID=2761120 RepID=A0A7X0SK58_9BACL|nr:family 1 glycosylhydrolase [Cohnella zeiphila]MBB6731464.1 family 1 glycosylhydrolase [Cohnella zeiphila]